MTRRATCHLLAGAALAGAVVMVVGTFAPWLQSGLVQRNAYRSAGVLQRLLGISGFSGAALDALPFLAVLCAVAAAGYLAGWARPAAVLLILIAFAMMAVTCAVLSTSAVGQVRIADEGPMITLAGSSFAAAAAIGLTILWRADNSVVAPSEATSSQPAGEL
jgi:hypothetical protein